MRLDLSVKMETAIECIISVLDDALIDLDDIDGSDFVQLLSHGGDRHGQIVTEVERLGDVTEENHGDFEEIMSRLERWNGELRGLVKKVHLDADVQRIVEIQSSNVITLSKEEDITLKVKKERRIKDLKLEIDQLIIKLDELIMSLHRKIEIASSNLYNSNNSGKGSFVFDDIEKRYSVALASARLAEMSANSSNQDLKNGEFEIEDEIETKDEENEKNYEEEEKEITTEPDTVSRIDDTTVQRRKIDQFTENLQEKIKIIHNTRMEKERFERLLNEERADPLNWTKFRYRIANGEFSDMDLGCIISSFKGSIKKKEDVAVVVKNMDDLPMKLDATYEVLSNTVQIEPGTLEVEFDVQIPWKLSIPYLMIRNSSKEVVIVCYDMIADKYSILDTHDLIFDDNKEGGFKLAEGDLPSQSCMCVVVSKRKIERLKVDKGGNKFVSSTDPRVVLNMPQNAVKIKISIEISVLPIESGQMNDLLSKSGPNNNLYSISPMVELNSDYARTLLRTISLQIPIPNTLAHANRGRAVSARAQTMDKVVKRSKSAITRQVSIEEDPITKIGLFNEQDKVWRTNNKLAFETNKNKDSVTIDIDKVDKQKIVVIRCNENFTDENLNRTMDIINKNQENRVVQFILRQHTLEPNRVIVVAANPSRMDKIQKYLTQENFSEEMSVISSEYVIQERSKLRIYCKGNIGIENGGTVTYRFHSQLPNRKEFYVKELDNFAQKSKDSYQGFVIISEVLQSSTNKLWETVINIPKLETVNKKGIKIFKDFDFQATDVISKDYLRYLSQQLGKDWTTLGRYLKVADVSIRRISNDPFIDTQTMAYECLLKWIKNATVYSKKVLIMEKALRSIGRFDLAEDLAQRVIGCR